MVIDNTTTPPQTNGTTTIRYSKSAPEELWEIPAGSTWTLVNVHVRTGLGDEADREGRFDVTLTPGQVYRAGIFPAGRGPLSTDPFPLAQRTVFAVLKTRTTLIASEDRGTGGTFHRHTVTTTVPTRVALVGASLTPPTFDDAGFPRLVDRIGPPSTSLAASTSHSFDVLPLVPGNHYSFALMVVDDRGNWDMAQEDFDTLRRKLTIKIPTVHIYNDGDTNTPGAARFAFRVSAVDTAGVQGNVLEEFSLPEMDIDDWSETDRPYAVGFAYAEMEPMSVPPQRPTVWVSSTATEEDRPWGFDYAGSLRGRPVFLPAGPAEKVTSSTFTVDCPPTSDGSYFHYGVDVTYSVDYLP